ncbi:hypothetical protein BGI33_02590 [Snodgrassella alvi]|nr:hypothetical protein BGI33_02590 [Snodgrassella alvi]PIT21096.1 hypothetical protein BGI34_01725 [Snodgrassella alvi]
MEQLNKTERYRYVYDALGRRIEKHQIDREGQPYNRTRFLWDGLRMIQETGSNHPTSLYIYTDQNSYEPLARIDTDGNQEQHIRYFHTDLNGCPEELTDANGELLWECSFQLWGKRIHEIEHQSVEQNLRYQGQYLDRETGLHYNTFRYYDPNIGRFTQPDPIGLLGGLNLYQYAPNGLTWIDPWGWVKCGTARKNRMPSKKNKNLDHSKTTYHADGSVTFYDHKGRAVTYSKDGVADFSPYAEQYATSNKFNGNRAHDNKIANEQIGYSGDKAPPGKVWHHVDKDYMILLDAELHNNFPHTGSASVLIHG